MADWWDIFSDISDAGLGIAQGLDAGMKPLQTWEGIRTTDLKNDAQEIGNRDLEYLQQAREGGAVPAWYGDWRDAGQSTFRKTTAANEEDIFGNQQDLRMMQRMASPEVQQMLQGLDPMSPEYRRIVGQQRGTINPYAAIGEVDKMNIPALEQRELSRQASDQLIAQYLRTETKNNNIQVQRGRDGKLYATIDGQTLVVDNPEALYRAASFNNYATPELAVNAGINQILAVNAGNANSQQKLQGGTGSTTAQNQALTQEGTNLRAEASLLKGEKDKIEAKPEYQYGDDATKAAMLTEWRVKEADLVRRAQEYRQKLTTVQQGGRLGGGYGGGGGGYGGGAPTGNSMGGGYGNTQVIAPPQGYRGQGQQPRPQGKSGPSADALMNPGANNAGGGGGPAPSISYAMPGDDVPMGVPSGVPSGGPGGAVATGAVAPTSGAPSPMSVYGRSAGFPQPMDDTSGPIYNFNPNSGDPNGGIFQSPWQKQGAVPPSSATSGMNPMQLQAFLQYMAPYIQPAMTRGTGQGLQQMLAMLQQRGMVG